MRFASIFLLTLIVPLSSNVTAQLTGTYTINPAQAASARNFQSIAAAVQELSNRGAFGQVFFDLYDDAGPFRTAISANVGRSGNAPLTLGAGAPTAIFAIGPVLNASPAFPVTFRPGPGESPVLDATGADFGIYCQGTSYVNFQGLEVRGARYDAVAIHAVGTDAVRGLTIERCYLHDCAGVGVLLFGNRSTLDGTIIRNNVFESLVTENDTQLRGRLAGGLRDGYLAGRGDSGTQVLHNTFLVTTLPLPIGFVVGHRPSGTGSASFERFVGNLVAKEIAGGTIHSYEGARSRVPFDLDYNAYYDRLGGAIGQVGTQGVVDLIAWQNLIGGGLEANSLSSNPIFAAGPTPMQYKLGPISPMIDRGRSNVDVAFDFDGQLRVGAPDIGADELDSCTSALFQANTPNATLTVRGQASTACVRSRQMATRGQLIQFRVESNVRPGVPWEALIDFRPLVAAPPGGARLADGQIANIDLFSPTMTFVFGRTWFSPFVPFPGLVDSIAQLPVSPTPMSGQVVIFDPSRATGLSLSAGAEIEVL